MQKITDYLKKVTEKHGKKRFIENCIIIIIIGIIIIIAGEALFKREDRRENGQHYLQKNNVTTAVEEQQTNAFPDEDIYNLEKRMEKILSQIDGAGNVNIMITFASGSESVPAYDTRKSESSIREEDGSGGTRVNTQVQEENNVVYEKSGNGAMKPVIIKEKSPEVKGVVVVADGANEPVVKENLIRAVQTLLDVPPHKVQVFARKK